MLHHTHRHLLGGVAIRTQSHGFGRPANGVGIELERTACYACTGWHTCLVFLTDAGVRIPLCEACLRVVVPRAIETGVEAPAYDGAGRTPAAASAGHSERLARR